MKSGRFMLADLIIIVISFVIPALLYSSLPDRVPTHWNFDGVADSYTAKPWGVFVMPITMAGLFLLLYLLPRISPRNFSISPFQRVYEIFRTAILGFLLIVTIVTLLSAKGSLVPSKRIFLAVTGLLIVIIGNYLGKVTRNFFIGIRTPWTLANQEVWFRTHRLAGKLVVLAGLIFFLFSLFGLDQFWSIGALITALLIPAVYSFFLYKKLEGFGEDSQTPTTTEL